MCIIWAHLKSLNCYVDLLQQLFGKYLYQYYFQSEIDILTILRQCTNESYEFV